ncbi:hypothetical protein J8281_05160 [Aquimarina sp. U1-2]|uniref:hypothetical protein n=1 Tax=Aquimarina sp. U1-2 TaxID=2823141 RepID=UPI001AEC8A88|nr:hypothetical protein [Aquimarina sp. U1-2]MBP2831571.1 hypothetical protein [Aquimarina sp. U1-2]
MTTQMHLAAQYLAAAAISFLKKKENDSHMNLKFSVSDKNLTTHPLNTSGHTLSLNYQRFTLEWNSKNSKSSLRLHQTKHIEIVKWIQETAEEANILDPYVYKFHYQLPYPSIDDDYEFQLESVDQLHRLAEHRVLAQQTLQAFLEQQQLTSKIRIWPHHFDTSAYAQLKNSPEFSIGLGLAIPDAYCNDYYFYLNGYQRGNKIATSSFNSISKGKWLPASFEGAVLPITGVAQDDGIAFFNEALKVYQHQIHELK